MPCTGGRQKRKNMNRLLTLVWAFLAPFSSSYAATGSDLVEKSGVQGGLVVCIGSTDAEFLADLRVDERYLVQALVGARTLGAVREAIHAKGLYGRVTVKEWDGGELPYTDNLVNLIVIDDQKVQITPSTRPTCP